MQAPEQSAEFSQATILPGIWIGSLIVNLAVAWHNGKLDITSEHHPMGNEATCIKEKRNNVS